VKEYFVELDRPRQLVYDFGAWEKLAEYFGEKTGLKPEEFDPAKMNITVRDLPNLVWAGVSWENPCPGLDEIKSLLNEGIRKGKYTILGLLLEVTAAIFTHAGMEVKQGEAEDKGKKGPGLEVPGSKKAGGRRPH
jgi:hypothetical protein